MEITRLCRVSSVIPFVFPISGRRRDFAFGLIDKPLRQTLRGELIRTTLGPLVIDIEHDPERMLVYFFENVFRYYQRSELGQYIHTVGVPGSTFVDVGANLGMYSLVARRHGMNSVAVEPDPKHSAFLQRNAAVFGSIVSVALADHEGSMCLYYEAGNPGATSLLETDGYIRGDNTVSVKTFSSAAESGLFGKPSHIGIVKIDVEGYEAPAVRGMSAFLEEGHRPSIWCEVRGDRSNRNGGSFRVVREILADYGYVAHELRSGKLCAVDDQELASRGVFDLLFTSVRSTHPGGLSLRVREEIAGEYGQVRQV